MLEDRTRYCQYRRRIGCLLDHGLRSPSGGGHRTPGRGRVTRQDPPSRRHGPSHACRNPQHFPASISSAPRSQPLLQAHRCQKTPNQS
ncbi:hypothetical protein Mapa_010596 [Marchantia paleacea]|nr:hypothetical protein Mapa_010596 [Marchantia paleacea]